MKTTKLLFLLSLLLFPVNITPRENPHKRDLDIVRQFFRTARHGTVADNVLHAALFFLNTPYAAHTLDGRDTESLTVNFREMDCMTFVENCLALSRALRYAHPGMECFERELRLIRYRGGRINTYTSRLHYTSDWIYDNVKKGVVEDGTYALGGEKYMPDVSYMSVNHSRYRQLKNRPDRVKTIAATERTINRRANYYFIPKREIGRRQTQIKNGDILCFTTSIPGLDISHLGIAYRHGGRLTFIHASSAARKVIINREPLTDYCNRIKSNTGVIVLRPMPYRPPATLDE
jgi:hypothetical protein